MRGIVLKLSEFHTLLPQRNDADHRRMQMWTSVEMPLDGVSSMPLSKLQKAGRACSVRWSPPYAGPVFTPLGGPSN